MEGERGEMDRGEVVETELEVDIGEERGRGSRVRMVMRVVCVSARQMQSIIVLHQQLQSKLSDST